MAKETMVADRLNKEAIDAGAKLIRKLDGTDLEISAAFWYLVPEQDVWRLMLASPEVDTEGPRFVYAKVQQVIRRLDSQSPISLSDVSVIDSKDPLVRLLRTAIHTGPQVSGIRFTRNTVNGHFIEDAYIYRLT